MHLNSLVKIFCLSILLMFAYSGVGKCAEAPKPIFYASMDGEADADIAAGNPKPLKAEGIAFVEGKKGKGVLIDDAGMLCYSTQGNINLTEGTVAMWVKLVQPLRMRPGWDRFFDLTIGTGNANALRILTPRQDPKSRIYCAINSQGKGHGIGATELRWKVGEWHHLALSWGKIGAQLFIDGETAGYNAEYVPPAGTPDIFIIGNDKTGRFPARAVIDEVYIFDRSMSGNLVRRVAGLPAYVDTESANLLRNSSFELGYFGWTFWWNSDLGTRWQIVEAECPHGRRALLVDRTQSRGPAWHVFVILGEWMPLEPGAEFTFSAYLKADKPNTAVALKIQNATKQHLLEKGIVTPKGIYKRFEIGTEWRRVSVTGTLPPAYKEAYRVNLNIISTGCKVWIDALQFAAGDLRDYAPAATVEMGYDTDRYGALYNLEETVRMRTYIYNDDKTPRGVTLHANLTDAYGERLVGKETTVLVPARTVWSDTIEVQAHRRGQYNLALALSEENGKTLQQGTLSFCVIKSHLSKPSPPRSPFGVTCGMQNMELKITRLRQVGIKHLRPGIGLSWNYVEPKKGNFNFGWSERFAEEYTRRGLMMLPVLGHTPPWARKKIEEVLHWRQGRVPPANLDDWSNYVRTVVSRFKGKVKEWEIWNEPNISVFFAGTTRDYFDILKAAYKACKTADPECRVFGCSTAGLNDKVFQWLEELFKLGALDYMDGISIHPYRFRELPEEKLADDIRKLIALMKKYGEERDIYYTEFGWPSTEDKRGFVPWFSGVTNEPSELNQAQMLVRSWVISLAEGVDKLYWYQWHAERWVCGPDLTALIRPDCFYTPKKAVVALNALIEKLENAEFIRPIPMQAEGQYGYEFRNPRGYVAVLWCIEGESKFKLTSIPKGLAVFDIWGNPVAINPDTRVLLLSESPIYVETASGLE